MISSETKDYILNKIFIASVNKCLFIQNKKIIKNKIKLLVPLFLLSHKEHTKGLRSLKVIPYENFIDINLHIIITVNVYLLFKL